MRLSNQNKPSTSAAQRAGYLTRNAWRGLGCVAVMTGMPLGSAFADTLHIRYAVSLLGLPLGTAGLDAKLEADTYALDVTAKLTGLASVVSNSKGAAASTGAVSAGKVSPSTYATSSSNSKETRTVRMSMAAGNVKGVDIAPPFDVQPDRVPLTEAHRRSIIDPVSALVMPVPAGADLVGAAACNRSLPIFDGYTRFDVTLSYVGIRNVKTKGYAGPVSVCAARYVPIAGHKADRPATKFMADNRDMEVWLLPVASARLEMPYRISVKTMVGTTVIEAQEVRVDGPTRASVAQ